MNAITIAQDRFEGGTRSRVVKGLLASGLGPALTAAIQLCTVPLLLHAWGSARYGDWLVLSAVPSYLALSDLGFGTASGSDMTVRVAADDRIGALRTFQSSWVLISAICTVPLALAAVSIWSVPWSALLKLSTISSSEAATVLIILGAYVLVGQQAGVFESGYRADGNFATGISGLALMRLSETAATTTVGVFGGSLVTAALTQLTIRVLGTAVYLSVLMHKSPWIKPGFKYAQLRTVRQLAKPALAFMSLPLGQALSIQGFTLIIAAHLGSTAVVAFSTARTATRVGLQLVNTVSSALWPEFSVAFGTGNIALARRLHVHACRACLGLSLVCCGFLWVAGPMLFRIWTGNRIVLNLSCFHTLLVVVVANALWYASSVIPMSTNQHSIVAYTYLASATLSLGACASLLSPLGIAGAAMSLLIVELVMAVVVFPICLRQLHETPACFWRTLLRTPIGNTAWDSVRKLRRSMLSLNSIDPNTP